MARSRAQRGFTLTELMVVMAILAIVSTLIVSVSGRAYGANARTTSQEMVSALELAKLRASSTRRVHRVRIEPHRMTIWSATTTGLTVQPTTNWELVRSRQLNTRVKIWDVQAGAITSPGAAITENTALEYDVDVRPDGQANASTVYLTDGHEPWRVVVYAATASAHARTQW